MSTVKRGCINVGAIAIAVALGFGSRCHAEPLRLTIDDAVARAVAASLDLGATRKDVTVAEANLERSKPWLPSNPFFTAGAQHATGFGPNYSFSLSQEFEVAGQRGARLNSARKEIEKAQWDVKTAEQALIASTKTLFLHALISLDRVAVSREGADAAAALTNTPQQTKTPSERQRIGINQARIQQVRARRELTAAEHARDGAFADLKHVLGLPSDQAIELLGAARREIASLPTDEALIARALERRADLAALRRAVEQADLHVMLTKREGIPNVTVSGTLARFEGSTLAGGDISVPIPVSQRKAPDIHEALAEYERSRLQVQDMEATIAKEVRQARLTCTVTGEDLQAQQRQVVPMSEENLAIERRLHQRGEATISDLIGLQIDLLTARQDYLEALETYNTALIELERVVGDKLFDLPPNAAR